MLPVLLALTLVPLKAAQPPSLVSVPEASPDCSGTVETWHADFAGARVSVVHDCGMSDRTSSVVVTIGDTSFVGGSTLIGYYGANMTEAPNVTSLLDESIGHGTLADGSAAMVRRVITDSYADCRCREKLATCCDGLDLSHHRLSFVQVCRVGSSEVACAQHQSRCVNDACTPVSLKKGVLVVEGETLAIQ